MRTVLALFINGILFSSDNALEFSCNKIDEFSFRKEQFVYICWYSLHIDGVIWLYECI